MLLRIGIDKGTDGALGPIFSDGTFEYIPISEGDAESSEDRTYANTIGRSGQPFSTYLPRGIANRTMHYDPEFNTFTYGDPTVKRKYLVKLAPGDLLVFYAGLTPFQHTQFPTGLYLIGYFTVLHVFDFNALIPQEINALYARYPNNAHLKRQMDPSDLVLIVGAPGQCKLLEKAIPISEKKLNVNGIPYDAVSQKMEQLLGISGSIQRSIPPRSIFNQEI
jgi:hypothetical protein